MTLDELERTAARHWQAPETEPLGQWLLRAAQGFTGWADSALAIGHTGLPRPDVRCGFRDAHRYQYRIAPPA